jgi:acylphosphatase
MGGRQARIPVPWVSASTAVVVRQRVVVHGWVQGVFFRDSLRREAARAGVAGWVRNTNDGGVEAVFEGAPDAVATLVAWCHSGPSRARVDRVDVTDEPPERLTGFRVRGGWD